jgi:hypothetical protein
MNFKERRKRRDLLFAILGITLLIFIMKTQLNFIRAGVNKVVLPIKILIYKSTESAKQTVNNLQDLNSHDLFLV